MKTYKLDLNDDITIKQLKEFIKDLPDDLVIDVYNFGDSGIINGVNLEVIEYGGKKEDIPVTYDITLNIEAESGYVY